MDKEAARRVAVVVLVMVIVYRVAPDLAMSLTIDLLSSTIVEFVRHER